MDSSELPVLGPVSETEPEVSWPGNWSVVVYDKPADIADSNNAYGLNYYTKSGAEDDFVSAHKNYGGAGSMPAGMTNKIAWCDKYAFCVQEGDQYKASIGYRYTAEFTGYLIPTMDSFFKDDLGWDMNAFGYNNLRFAIFVDHDHRKNS